MLHIVERVEKIIIRALIILLLLAMVLGTVELGRITILEIFAPPLLLLDISKIFESFGLALVILISLELLKVLKLFLLEDKIKPEIIVEIAVIAVCNKIITLDTKHTSGDVLLGIAAVLVGLSIGYFVFRFRKSNREAFQKPSAGDEPNSKSCYEVARETENLCIRISRRLFCAATQLIYRSPWSSAPLLQKQSTASLTL